MAKNVDWEIDVFRGSVVILSLCKMNWQSSFQYIKIIFSKSNGLSSIFLAIRCQKSTTSVPVLCTVLLFVQHCWTTRKVWRILWRRRYHPSSFSIHPAFPLSSNSQVQQLRGKKNLLFQLLRWTMTDCCLAFNSFSTRFFDWSYHLQASHINIATDIFNVQACSRKVSNSK